MQQENDTPREKKSAKNLEGEEKSTTFAPADDENGQRLQVNITQNAGEEGSPNRMGDLNEKDRVAYKNALETLRRKDISDEQRNAAEAVMNEIEQRRKEQMEAMVAAALDGIEGVSDVTTNVGIGVYQGEKGEVVEYTFEVDATVTNEEAFRAAMASVAEVTRQDSFIINYLDETLEHHAPERDDSAAAQVRVKLDRPLSRTEQAQLTEMFSSLKLGLTVTNKEISTSNFTELSDDDFNKLATYLLDGFNNGNAQTTLQNAQRVAANGRISELAGIQEKNVGNGQSRIWSGIIESRTNYSTYYEARKEYYRNGDDRGTRKDYTDGEGNPAYRTTDKGTIPTTNLTPSREKGRVSRTYNESEDKATLSPDFALSAPAISEGYKSLRQEVESIIDNEIAESQEFGEEWDGNRDALIESVARFVRGIWGAAAKQRGSQNQDMAWLGVATFVEEARNACSNEVERAVFDEIAARASEAYNKLSEKERANIVEKYRRKNDYELRHLSASPLEALVYEAWRKQPNDGYRYRYQNSAEAIKARSDERRLKRNAEREARRKAREAEREAKEAEREAKKAQQEAERKAKKANEISERDRIAKALLDKHGSVENYLENTIVHGRDGKPFMHSGKPLTLADYLKQKASVRSAIAGRYMTENNSESIKTVLDDLLGDANAALAYSDTRVNGNRARLASNTKADALETILAAERAAQTTQHIKDGMAELGLPVEEEAKPDIDETIDTDADTNTETETETENETDTETDEETETETDEDAETDEEQDAYEREREQERADDKADEEYLQQQEQEFEKAFSKSREGIEERIAFLEEKIDYDMITPEEEAELAELRKKVGKARDWDGKTPQFHTENQGKNRTPLTPAQRAATQAMLDMLDAAGLKTHFVSEAEMEAVLKLREINKMSWDDALSAIAAVSHTITDTDTHGQSSNSKDGAKVQQNSDITNALNKLTEALSGENAYTPQEFVGQIALALGIKDASTNKSNYTTITLGDGTTANIRISNHQGNAINFTIKGKGGDVNIGFVIKDSKTAFRPDNNSNYVEFVYYGDKTTEAERQKAIVDGIRHLIETGKFEQIPPADNINTSGAFRAQAMIVFHGSGAKFNSFDSSYMGSGEGAQAYGWGHYVTEAFDIGKGYAMAIGKRGRKLLYKVEIPDDNGSNYLSYTDIVPQYEVARMFDILHRKLIGFSNIGVYDKDAVVLRKRLDAALKDKRWKRSGRNVYNFISNIISHYYHKDDAWTKKLLAEFGFITRSSPEDASQFLNSIGYTGIKYPANFRNGGRADGAKNYVIFNDNDLQIKDHIQFLRTPQGIVYGYAKGGEIYLNSERLNPNTPLHEYTHLWDTACRQKNPELWKRGVELMKQLPLWEEIKNDPAYSNLTTDDEIASEVHSRLTGKDGAAIMEKAAQEAASMDAMGMTERLGVIGRLKNWLNDFWRWAKETLVPWTKEEAAQVSLDDFVRMPLADLVRGVNPHAAAEQSDDVQFMGSRVDKRMSEIADHYNGKELTHEQQAIVDVFSGAKNNAAVTFTDENGQEHILHIRSGNENNGGVKHAIYRHYNDSQSRFEVDDIAKIPTILEQGQRTEKGNSRVEYTYTDESGIKYIVGTEIRDGRESLVTFYTNKEASQTTSQNTQLSAQEKSDASNSSAKVDKNSESAKHDEWEKARFSIGNSNTSADAVVRIADEFAKTLDSRGLKNKFFRLIEEIQNGYILLHKMFTSLNEARVASGRKALSVSQDIETVAAGTRGRAAGMLAVFDSYGHKREFRDTLKRVEKAFGVEQKEAKERLDDYLMARSMQERIEEARQELANGNINEDLLYRLQKASEWETAFADKYGMSAADYISEFEGKVNTRVLWKKINDATAYLREQAYSIGWISAEEKAKQDNRKYYVPNRNAAEVLGSEKRNEIKNELGLTDDAQVRQWPVANRTELQRRQS